MDQYIDGIKVEMSTVEQTARVLDVINRPVGNKEYFTDLMLSMIGQYGHRSEYFGTAGFYIICFDEDLYDGTKQRHAKAVLMPFSVERYLTEIGRLPRI